jgi:Ser/Thr protein kinase RdoA (MazF antagonist)
MDDGLVYGMGTESLVEPDWPPLTLEELADVLGGGVEEITWHSPRPLSTTAKVRMAGGEALIVKRLPQTLRTPEALAEEHGFMDHLRERGIPIPKAWTTGTRGEFTYEVQEVGVGEDLYQGTFSWSPYQSNRHAGHAGSMLRSLHRAAVGYEAPARPARPLVARFNVFSGRDPIAAIERLAAERPALGDFLAARDWRGDVERVHLAAQARLLPLLDDLEPLWTHNDWHGSNLLWTDERLTGVIDFGLADRTTAVHDLATALERFAVDWISIRDGGPANVPTEQVMGFLHGHTRSGQVTAAEFHALPLIFPLVHADYELSEIDYFLSVVPGDAVTYEKRAENAEIAYRDYFLGHTEWTQKTEEGQAFLGLLRERHL